MLIINDAGLTIYDYNSSEDHEDLDSSDDKSKSNGNTAFKKDIEAQLFSGFVMAIQNFGKEISSHDDVLRTIEYRHNLLIIEPLIDGLHLVALMKGRNPMHRVKVKQIVVDLLEEAGHVLERLKDIEIIGFTEQEEENFILERNYLVPRKILTLIDKIIRRHVMM